jgi:hypothetical protein
MQRFSFGHPRLTIAGQSELVWRSRQQVKLAECDVFEAADEDFEIERNSRFLSQVGANARETSRGLGHAAQ